MSQGYCAACRYRADIRFGPDACPFNYLYWDFIARHQAEFLRNPRMALVARNLAQQDPDAVAAMRAAATAFLDALPRA
jgi:deoxyribodipyrimidine photolyase-related protein